MKYLINSFFKLNKEIIQSNKYLSGAKKYLINLLFLRDLLKKNDIFQ